MKEEAKIISPAEAKVKLIEDIGYGEDIWKIIERRKIDFGSHETRALIKIAQGSKPRNLGQVIRELKIIEAK